MQVSQKSLVTASGADQSPFFYILGIFLLSFLLVVGIVERPAYSYSYSFNLANFIHTAGAGTSADTDATATVTQFRNDLQQQINQALGNYVDNSSRQAKEIHDRWDTVTIFGTCLQLQLKFHDILRSINKASSFSFWGDLFAAIIYEVVSYIETSVCQYIATEVNNLLNSVCLPLPKLGFNINMQQPRSVTCNGLSLGNSLFALQAGGVSPAQAAELLHMRYSPTSPSQTGLRP